MEITAAQFALIADGLRLCQQALVRSVNCGVAPQPSPAALMQVMNCGHPCS
jgi:hypothetical protein